MKALNIIISLLSMSIWVVCMAELIPLMEESSRGATTFWIFGFPYLPNIFFAFAVDDRVDSRNFFWIQLAYLGWQVCICYMLYTYMDPALGLLFILPVFILLPTWTLLYRNGSPFQRSADQRISCLIAKAARRLPSEPIAEPYSIFEPLKEELHEAEFRHESFTDGRPYDDRNFWPSGSAFSECISRFEKLEPTRELSDYLWENMMSGPKYVRALSACLLDRLFFGGEADSVSEYPDKLYARRTLELNKQSRGL
jgi:hypothetical protein